MSAPRPPRGTHDLLGDDMRLHRHVGDTARAVMALYGFGEIATPIFEHLEVFQRTLGDTSDVVAKEMYVFQDRGGDALCLRPENTAAVCRALITCGLAQDLPQKLFYGGPMFRYERPQKGRLRQFHQIGVELVGPGEPEADVEVIALGAHLLEALGLAGRVRIELNSLGDTASRSAYRAALVDFLGRHRERLSPASLERLERNPLRILDSKDEGDRALLDEAPDLASHLTDDSRRFFDAVREGLTALGVEHVLAPRLVRGLDYYNHTAFEFVTTELGAQGTVLAGGRYDGLVRDLGGPDIPGVGWAAGIERLAMLLDAAPPAPRPVALVPIGGAAEAMAWALAQRLRRAGVPVELAFRGKPGQRMRRADKVAARVAVSIGDAELARGLAKVRDLDLGRDEEVPIEELVTRLGAEPRP